MSVLLIAGSPSEPSRTAALLEAAGHRLEKRGVRVDRLKVRKLSPQQDAVGDHFPQHRKLHLITFTADQAF